MNTAVILSGCGKADGSEIQEAVSVLIHLSRIGSTIRCFAPDAAQVDVVDHVTGKTVAGASRNVMVEAARISRGEIAPLSKLNVAEFDALALPGGFGAAKNLCDFASKGAECSVNPDVERAIKAFHTAKKPIALCCIAPVIAARVLGKKKGGPGVSVTIGDDAGTAGAIESMGSRNVSKGVTEACVDAVNRIVTAPAYMYGEATPHEVFVGIGKMVDELGRMTKTTS